MQINVNTDEMVVMTNKLEKLHRSAFPSAVRGTLNSLAFNMKQHTLLSTTQSTFTTRQKNFFKANSKVFVAKGFDIRSMEATVGMVEGRLKGGNNYAVKNLVQQEIGGDIGGKSLIPISVGARTSKSYQKNVKKDKRVGSIRGVINARRMSGANDKEKYTKAAIRAGVGGYVLSPDKNPDGSRTLYLIKNISRKGGDTSIGQVPIYTYKSGRAVKVKPTKFMERSGMESSKGAAKIYQKEGVRQIKRVMSK